MEERGVIQYRDRKKQIITFENLRYGTITPTDIDGSMDFQGDIFVFFELKYGDAQLKDGQRMFLKNICDGLRDGGREACVLIARHNVEDPKQDVDAAECIVTEAYIDGQWKTLQDQKTLEEQVDAFLRWAQKRKPKRIKMHKMIQITNQYVRAINNLESSQ